MSDSLYLAFLAVSVAVIVIPGPSIMLIVATGLRDDRRAALSAVAGTSIAMSLQLAVAVAGLTSLIAALTGVLGYLRWLGAAYLCYLGIRHWREPIRLRSSAPRRGTAFGQGFMVSLLNPTTMLFFVAFFPQFMTANEPAAPQLLRLSVSFWVLALGFDCLYALSSARLGQMLGQERWARLRGRLAGVVLLSAAVALILSRPPH